MKKFLAMVIACSMLFTLLSVPAFAADVLPTAESGVITLTEDITLTSNVTFNEFVTINLNNCILKATKLIFNKGAEIYGGTISFDDASSADGFLCADYKHHESSTVTIRNATISAENSIYCTGVFYAENADDTIILDNVQVKVSGSNSKLDASTGSPDPGSGVFYSPSSYERGKVELINNTTISATKVNAIFFASNLAVNGAVINCGEVYRPVFRQAAGTVTNTTVTIDSIESGRAVVEDVSGLNSGVITFTSSTISAPEGTTIAKFKNEGSKAVADSSSKLGDGSGVTQSASAVAKIGSEEFSSLQAAFNAAQDDDTIYVLSDITFTKDNACVNGTYLDGICYEGDKSFIVDLGGHTISENGDINDYVIYLKNKGSKDNVVTLKNGTITTSEKSSVIATITVGISSATTAQTTLNLQNITVENHRELGNSALVISARNDATVNLNSGTTVISDGVSYGVSANTSTATVNVNSGAKVIQKNSGSTASGNSVYTAVTGKGTVNIYDGAEITSDLYGIHTLTTGTPVVNVYGGTITAPVAIKASTNGGTGEVATVSVYGGTINGALEEYTANGNVLVYGGTFTCDVDDYVVGNLYQDERSDGKVTVGTLPQAEVSKLNAMTIGDYSVYDLLGNQSQKLADGVEPKELQIAMEFEAKDTEAQAKANAFADYTTDFFITVSGLSEEQFVGNGCYLAGNYYPFGWIVIPLDGFPIQNGMTYSVITSVGFDFSYADICTSVKDFKCGIYFPEAVLDANENMKVKLELGISESFDNAAALTGKKYITIDEYTYTAADLKGAEPTSIWSTATDSGYYMDDETAYGVMRFLFHADVKNMKVTETGIKYVNASNIGAGVVGATGTTVAGTAIHSNAFYGDVDSIPYGTTGDYYAVAYIKLEGMDDYIWSDFVKCSPNFNKLFTNYNGGANE